MQVPTPFTNIALSLSGGGYRATTFHLGAMSYLNSKEFKNENLLKNVKVISTISGGTLTGVMYAHKLANKGDYQDCFDSLYHLLTEDNLVEHALHKLSKPKSWKNKHKSRDMINAFSEVYNEEFYDNATFGDLQNGAETHLTDAIFGSSEFTTGIQFRFQKKEDQAKFGNGNLNLPIEASNMIRLADATAASSCFPGGFEPMVMPHDFADGPESEIEKVWKEKEYQNTAVMDGGIVDNQGIEGVKLVETRNAKRDKKPFIGTYIVSDVSADQMKPYKVPILKYSDWKNLFTLNRLNIFLLVGFVLLVGLIVAGLPVWGVIVSSVILTFMMIYLIVFIAVRQQIKNAIGENFGEEAVPELMKDFGVLRRTPIYILIYLVKFRISSVMKMVSNVFLQRIRRLQLDHLYADESWNYRFKSNYIYSLFESKEPMSEALSAVINMANNMPTTLWFSPKEKEEKMLDNLIAAGQISLCYNLRNYAMRIKTGKYKDLVWAHLSEEDKEAIIVLHELMEEDWKKFQTDPFWLLSIDKNNSKKAENNIA